MIKIGITGGIGSGKSIVSRLFEVIGIPVYDSDSRAKLLMIKSRLIRRQLIQLLGEEAYKNEELNRSFISERVFKDSSLLARLNEIVHPVVFSDFVEWCKEQNELPFVACESAIMYECGLNAFMNKIILVDAPEELRIERVIKRNGFTRQKVKERIAHQKASEEKAGQADFVVLNDDKHPLIPQINAILHQMQTES